MSEMVLSREEKEKLVLDLYIQADSKELKMSPNQIRDIVRRHKEKDNAIANRKRELSLQYLNVHRFLPTTSLAFMQMVKGTAR